MLGSLTKRYPKPNSLLGKVFIVAETENCSWPFNQSMYSWHRKKSNSLICYPWPQWILSSSKPICSFSLWEDVPGCPSLVRGKSLDIKTTHLPTRATTHLPIRAAFSGKGDPLIQPCQPRNANRPFWYSASRPGNSKALAFAATLTRQKQ